MDEYKQASMDLGTLADSAPGYNNPIAALGGLDSQYSSQEALLSARMQNAFNSAEALKNRQWQEYMSNTANQRAVKDLELAGFSPLALLGNTSSASQAGGSAASSGSSFGGKGSQSSNILGQIMSAVLLLGIASANRATREEIAKTTNDTKMAIAQDRLKARFTTAEKYDKNGFIQSILKYK